MSTILLQEYADGLQALYTAMERVLGGLPAEALDWRPGPDMNSLGVLAVHTAGSQQYWIAEVAGGQPSHRDRDAEFRSGGLDAAALIGRLAQALARSQAAIAALDVARLDEERIAPRDGRRVTVAWCLLHALEHTALHLGHMEITRQLWDQRHET